MRARLSSSLVAERSSPLIEATRQRLHRATTGPGWSSNCSIIFNFRLVPDDEGDEEDPYLRKVRRAGGFPQYEAQVTKSLAAIFEPKFPKLPAEVIPTIVAFWAHVGDY